MDTAPARLDRPVPRPGFPEVVRAEPFPTSLRWGIKDTLTALIIPVMFLGAWILMGANVSDATLSTVDTTFRIVVFIALVLLNKELLARHWTAFRRATGKSVLVVLAATVLTQVVITVSGVLTNIRDTSPGVVVDEGSADDLAGGGADPLATYPFIFLLFLAFNPVVTALIEDFVFRHTLMLKFPVWSKTALAVAVVLVNSFLFGAVHIMNFGGNLLGTVPYMFAGLFLNLVYLWTRNIWHVLLAHGLNNALISVVGTLLVGLLRLVGA